MPASRTLRMPREHFEADERGHLLPAPAEPYDVSAQDPIPRGKVFIPV